MAKKRGGAHKKSKYQNISVVGGYDFMFLKAYPKMSALKKGWLPGAGGHILPMKLEKNKLDLYYKSRKKLSDLYNSEINRVEFKLIPKDLMMMDNYRVLHGRTKFNPEEGKRFLQGCYIDFDSTEGKLRHLKRKFNL